MQAISDWWRDRLTRRRAIRELERMPDEALWDLGIIRAQIRDYVHARGACAPKPAPGNAASRGPGAVILAFPAGGRAATRRGRAA